MMEAAVHSDKNTVMVQLTKLLSYKNLTGQVREIWQVATDVVPFVAGKLGTIFSNPSASQDAMRSLGVSRWQSYSK